MLQTAKMGVIGLGCRGQFLLEEFMTVEGVQITAVCDEYADRAQIGVDKVISAGFAAPAAYTDYRKLLAEKTLDGVIVPASWTSHFEIAIAAMQAGVRVAIEVGGATSLDECFELVRVSERTGVPCMMLENCCYGREEMAILNMIKQQVFGELIHCECGYLHDLRDEVCLGAENRHYRLDNYLARNGDNYPTHGIGPIAKYLNINRGNRFVSLVSVGSKSRGMQAWVKEHLAPEHVLQGREFNQSDIVTTIVKCANGETVTVTLDTSLPRPYSRGGKVQGTKGIWSEELRKVHIAGRTKPHCWEDFDPILEEYDHPLWKEYAAQGVHTAGHGGMDYLCLCAFAESVRKGIQPPIDVYDAATWMAFTVLSEQSVALGGAPMPFPDFTHGDWIHRKPDPQSKYALDRICKEAFEAVE